MARYEFEQPDDRLEFTGERYTTDVGDKIAHEHLHRYLFALRHCAGKRVVDVACGEGYGASFLAKAAGEVVGVDSSAATIEHAAKTYRAANIVFHAADAASVPVEDGWADVVVSFETIEHLEDQPAFLAEVVRILRPDGLLILSTPDRTASRPDAEANPFHVHELDGAELAALLDAHFARFVVGGQRSDAGSSIAFPAAVESSQAATFFDRAGEGAFDGAAELPAPAYLIALATSGALPAAGSSTLFDSRYLPRLHAAYHDSLAELGAQIASRDARVRELERDAEAKREELLATYGREQALVAHVASLNMRVSQLAQEFTQLTEELERFSSDTAPPAAERPRPGPPVERAAVGAERLIRFEDDDALAPELRDASIVSGAAAWTRSTSTARMAERLAYRPLVSILMPAFNTPPNLLRAAVSSVLAQSYREWELVIADDGSSTPGFEPALAEIATWDPRIRVARESPGGGISEATNAALELATGEFVAMLDHDDELHPDALYEVVRALDADRELDAIYTDQEYIEADGSTGEPLLKPDWSPTLFCGVMYVGHLLVVRRELALALGGFDSRFDNVQDFEFMLRLSERTDRIAHVPRVLYRWRRIPGSVAFHGDEKAGIETLQAAAVTAHLERRGVRAFARPHPRHAHRAELIPLDDAVVSVSLVVLLAPGDEPDAAALDELARRSGGAIGEVIVCGPGSSFASNGRTRASSLREATGRVTSDLVLTIEHGLVPDSDDWLANLAVHAGAEDVAAVSPVVLGAAGPRVEDAGLIIGRGGEPGAAMRGWDSDEDGYAGSLSCAREVSAVSGACALIETATLERLGGFSELYVTSRLAWLDLSLRARAAGLRNVVTPRAVVRRTGGEPATTLGFDPLDRRLLRDSWAAVLSGHDPYHNPNFPPAQGGYGR